MARPRILVFASGTKTGGGSGFRKLVEESQRQGGDLEADIIGVFSNHIDGGVKRIAEEKKVPFHFFDNARNATARQYQYYVEKLGAEWVALSGWLKLVKGLDPRRTINIHPGPLPKFGGAGMYGQYVHQAVLTASQTGGVIHSAVSMHFVDKDYDLGPVFFRLPVEIEPDDIPETLGKRVNRQEHIWQPFITNLVVHGQIKLDLGEDSVKVIVPEWYKQFKGCPLELV